MKMKPRDLAKARSVVYLVALLAMPQTHALASADVLPQVDATCLQPQQEGAVIRVDADGRASGVPTELGSALRLVAGPQLTLAKLANTIRRLQGVSAILEVLVRDGVGRPVSLFVSLESDLDQCFPLPVGGKCAKPKRIPRLSDVGLLGVLNTNDSTNEPLPRTVSANVVLDKNQLELRLGSRREHGRLNALATFLSTLPAGPNDELIFHVNATGATTWQSVVSALALCYCRVREAPNFSYSSVILGQ